MNFGTVKVTAGFSAPSRAKNFKDIFKLQKSRYRFHIKRVDGWDKGGPKKPKRKKPKRKVIASRVPLSKEERAKVDRNDRARKARVVGDPWIHFTGADGNKYKMYYKGRAIFIQTGLEGYQSVVLVGVNKDDYVDHYMWCENKQRTIQCWKVKEAKNTITVNVGLQELKMRANKKPAPVEKVAEHFLDYSENVFLIRAGIPYPVDQEAFLQLHRVPQRAKNKIARAVIKSVAKEESLQLHLMQRLFSMHLIDNKLGKNSTKKNSVISLAKPSKAYFRLSNILLRRVFALTWYLDSYSRP
jgi:hypothetical protein